MSRNSNTINIKVRKQWEVPTGHREDRRVTTMDNRPKRQRTRQGTNKQWRKEYDI